MTVLSDPDRSFALDHVPTAQRDGVAALWALDEHLGQLVASTTQPPLGQMRLLWWREALETGARGHPVLEAMTSLRTAGIDARALDVVIDGWEELLEPLPLDDDQLARYAAFRGGQLFALSARLLMGVCPSRAERLGRLLISVCAVRTPKRRHARSKWRGFTCQRQISKRRHDRCAFLFDWRETISWPEGARPEPRGDCCAVSRSDCHDPYAHVISTIAGRVRQFFENSVAARAWGALFSSSAFLCAKSPVVGQSCRMRLQST